MVRRPRAFYLIVLSPEGVGLRGLSLSAEGLHLSFPSFGERYLFNSSLPFFFRLGWIDLNVPISFKYALFEFV